MSSNRDLNPYEAPVSQTSFEPEVTDERLAFSTEVTLDDLQRANASAFRQVFLVLCIGLEAFFLPISGLATLGLFVKFLRVGSMSIGDLLLFGVLAVVVLSLAVLIGTYFFRGRMLARRLPYLLGHTHGWLSPTTLCQSSANVETELNMEMVQGVRIQRDCLIIRFNPSPLVFDVIPMRAFERPEAVRALVSELNQRKTPVVNFFTDPRRLEEVKIPATEQIPNDAVLFSGHVTTEDIRESPIYRVLQRVVWYFLAIGIGFPALVIGFGWSSFTWLTLTTLFIPWILFKAYRSTLGPLMKPNTPIRYSSGYLDSEMMCTYSFSDKSRVKWAHYQSMQTSESTISLELKGKMKLIILFARRQFASDADWNKAIEMIRNAVSQKK